MIITQITAQKRKGRYNLYVDGSFFSGLDDETIVKASLKVGKEVNKEELEELIIESETRSAFEKIINLISRRMYSKRDLINKLKDYGYSKKCVNGAINKAQDYGYINDELYAKLLVESKPLKSKMEIKNALFLKGINSNLADTQLNKISVEEESERAIILAEKYVKNKEINEKTIAGLYGYLARKGFKTESINRVLRKYKHDEVID